MYYVNLYQTTKCYGGPEEGGWYYEEGVYHSCMGAYSNRGSGDLCFNNQQVRGGRFGGFSFTQVLDF